MHEYKVPFKYTYESTNLLKLLLLLARKGGERSVNQQLSNKEGRSGAMQASLSVSVAILFKIVWPDFIQVGYKNIKF